MIHIVNIPSANIVSVGACLRRINIRWELLTATTELVPGSDAILIPGVGAFDVGATEIECENLDMVIRQFATKGGLIVGICLGCQLLLGSSEEAPASTGLGLLPGVVRRLPDEIEDRVPRIGWAPTHCFVPCPISDGTMPRAIFDELNGHDVYFCHSYYCDVPDEHKIMGFRHAEKKLPAVIGRDNILGFQFHPELSGSVGSRLLACVFGETR